MGTATVVDVPGGVAEDLIAFLGQRYAELESLSEVQRTISFRRGKSPDVIYEAEVTYFHHPHSSHALFEFAEHVDKHGGLMRRWYCRNDWND